MIVQSLSVAAASFPSEVDYADLVGARYRRGGRGADGTYDCLGILLEVYRRAGVGIPDPTPLGQDVDLLYKIFDDVDEPSTVLDIAEVTRSGGHVWVLVRPGLFLQAKQFGGVRTVPAKAVAQIANVKYWRLKSDLLT